MCKVTFVKTIQMIVAASLLMMMGTVLQADEYSFEAGCHVVSSDGTTQFQILDILSDVSPTGQKMVAAAADRDGVLKLPGLDIAHRGGWIENMQMTSADWTALGGVAVGMTKNDAYAVGGTSDGRLGTESVTPPRIRSACVSSRFNLAVMTL